MFAFHIISLLVLASSAWTAPTIPGPSCNGLGVGAFDVAANFSLAALNVTLPNVNTTGAPLVLGQAGAIDGATFSVLSTLASFPYNQGVTFSLNEGALAPNLQGITPVDGTVNPGDAPGFVMTSLNAPSPAHIYCAVANTDPNGGGTGHPILAVNGDTGSFSLCRTGNWTAAQTNLVWKAKQGGAYEFDTCYAVKIQLVGLAGSEPSHSPASFESIVSTIASFFLTYFH